MKPCPECLGSGGVPIIDFAGNPVLGGITNMCKSCEGTGTIPDKISANDPNDTWVERAIKNWPTPKVDVVAEDKTISQQPATGGGDVPSVSELADRSFSNEGANPSAVATLPNPTAKASKENL